MQELDADYARLLLHDDRIVVVETRPGVIVEGTMVKQAIDLIERHIPGDYVAIIDRKNEYKLMRLEIYKEINARPRIKGIAIVTHSKTSDLLTNLEIPLAEKPIAKFASLEAAFTWARELVVR